MGSAPRALAGGDLDNNGSLDLVVANSGGSSVSVFLGDRDGSGDADGTFSPGPGSPLAMGAGPWGVALGHFNADPLLDLVTADHDASPTSTVSVRIGTGGGAFDDPTAHTVEGVPIAVAGFDATDDGLDDVSVVTGNHTLALFERTGNAAFNLPVSFPVRTRPSAIVPVDADADGRTDLAIPCRDADGVLVLLSRPPGFAQAATVELGAGAMPTGAATADLDGDGDLDLAVVESGTNRVSILKYDAGAFVPHTTLAVAAGPQAVVAADFDRDGILDLAVSCTGAGQIDLFEGLGGADFNKVTTPITVSTPDDLVAGDFDRDGDADIAVCIKADPGYVNVRQNQGSFGFADLGSTAVGKVPTSIVTADFDRDGKLDVATANDNSNSLTVLYGAGNGTFSAPADLPLTAPDTSPLSVAAGDLDGDGDDDLATVAFGGSMLSVFENDGGSFPNAPFRFEAVLQPLFLTVGDINRDGREDLVVAAEGVKVLAGRDGLAFDPGTDLVAGLQPTTLVLGDFNRDGRHDIAATNHTSDDVSILYSTACLPRHLVITESPASCGAVGPLTTSKLEVRDDAGNLALCETGDITASIVPGTGAGGATLLGTTTVTAAGGQATFASLGINEVGPRYQLQYSLTGVPAALSRSFTLGATVSITGAASVCPETSEPYAAEPGFDSYKWTLDGVASDWRSSTELSEPAPGPGHVVHPRRRGADRRLRPGGQHERLGRGPRVGVHRCASGP